MDGIISTIDYNGETWSYIYLDPPRALEQDSIDEILYNVIDMEHTRDNRRVVKGENYDGELFMRGLTFHGTFFGRYFVGKFEHDEGATGIGVMLLRPVNPDLN